jgi:hypothetical protein
MPCPFHPPWFQHSNYTWWRIQVLIMQFSPNSRHFVPLRSKYSQQRPVLKHPQSMFIPQCRRPSFTPIQNHRKMYRFLYSNFRIRAIAYNCIALFLVLSRKSESMYCCYFICGTVRLKNVVESVCTDILNIMWRN